MRARRLQGTVPVGVNWSLDPKVRARLASFVLHQAGLTLEEEALWRVTGQPQVWVIKAGLRLVTARQVQLIGFQAHGVTDWVLGSELNEKGFKRYGLPDVAMAQDGTLLVALRSEGFATRNFLFQGTPADSAILACLRRSILPGDAVSP